MQDNETPIGDDTTEGNTEVTTEVTVEPDAPDTNPIMQAFADAYGLPVGMINGAAIPPEPPEGKYDAVYNREAYSRRNMRQGHKPKKMDRMFIRGEQMEIKGELFKVTAVGHKTMTLQLLPQPKETEISGTETEH